MGIIFALLAGVFFGIIGPITKTAYNLGAGIGLAIFLRYIVALIIVSPLIPNQQNLFSIYKNNIREGKWISWYENGQKKAEVNYINKNTKDRAIANFIKSECSFIFLFLIATNADISSKAVKAFIDA